MQNNTIYERYNFYRYLIPYLKIFVYALKFIAIYPSYFCIKIKNSKARSKTFILVKQIPLYLKIVYAYNAKQKIIMYLHISQLL